MAQNKGSCANGDNCGIPQRAFIDQLTKYKMPQNDYVTGSYFHAIFPTLCAILYMELYGCELFT